MSAAPRSLGHSGEVLQAAWPPGPAPLLMVPGVGSTAGSLGSRDRCAQMLSAQNVVPRALGRAHNPQEFASFLKSPSISGCELRA